MFTVKAVMNDIGVIEVSIIRSFYDGISNTFYLKNQFGEMTQLRIMSCKKESNAVKYYLDGSNIKIGEEYYIVDDHNYVASLEFGMIVKSSQFDSAYFYDGDDLGPTYTKEATTFKVWAPTASVAFVQLVNKGDIETYQMKRDNGVYSVTINGDLDGKYYQYLVKVNGVFNTSIDPYAYASSPNHEYSCVIDLEKTNVNLNKDNLKVLDSYCDAIIYELSVRDISYDDHSNIKNKSKFLGLTEEGTKTNKNYPTGLDYIASLGVTHVQLQPIYDFGSVEETNQFLKYNTANLIDVKTLAQQFCRFKLIVFLLLQGIIPASHTMINISTETNFKFIQSVQWMRSIRIWRNTKHIIFCTTKFL